MVTVYSLGVIHGIHALPTSPPPSATATTTTANGIEQEEKLPEGESSSHISRYSDYAIHTVS